MSYSRWITSYFYTYWCSSDAKQKEDELFACHISIKESLEFKYGEVKEMLETPALMKEQISSALTQAEIYELSSYMERFVNDVDEEYSTNNEEEENA